MADALDAKKISAFIDNAAPADTDYFLNATGDVMKRTKVSQLLAWLKEKLGINSLNTNLTGKYVLARVDTVSMSAGSLAADTISDTITVTFEKVADDAICIPICVNTGWSICTKYEINGNKLSAQFGCWSGSHSAGGFFKILQFVKAS